MKNITWLIQSSGFTSSNIVQQYELLQKLKYDVKDFGVIPFTSTITNLENILQLNTNYIVRGGTKLLTILNNITDISEMSNMLSKEQIEHSEHYLSKLKQGIDYDVNKFDQQYYKQFNLPLLNEGADYIPFSEAKNVKYTKPMFIKPSRDLKAFDGGIIEAGTTIEEFITNGYFQSYYTDEVVVINDIQTIYVEYRFFIIDGIVITGSIYKRGNIVAGDPNIPNYIVQAASEYALLYKPADIFVMDLAETDSGIKIIEYNCWNASGLYSCDVKKLFHEVNEYKSIK